MCSGLVMSMQQRSRVLGHHANHHGRYNATLQMKTARSRHIIWMQILDVNNKVPREQLRVARQLHGCWTTNYMLETSNTKQPRATNGKAMHSKYATGFNNMCKLVQIVDHLVISSNALLAWLHRSTSMLPCNLLLTLKHTFRYVTGAHGCMVPWRQACAI